MKFNLLHFSLCPFPLMLMLDATEKSLALSSLLPHSRYLSALIKTPLSLLFCTLNSSSSFFSNSTPFPSLHYHVSSQ